MLHERRQVIVATLLICCLASVVLLDCLAKPADSIATRHSYLGSYIGKLTDRTGNGISGEVFAVDEQTLFIKSFNYDGRASDAYFWSSAVASSGGGGHAPVDSSGAAGFIVPDEKGSTKPLEKYTNKDVVLRLPEGKTLREIHWLSVWSRTLKVSVGDVTIGRESESFIIPRPLEINAFSSLAHGLKSGPITIVDAQTFLVPDFHYDGTGPEAYFWLTRSSQGLGAANSLKLRDENGASTPLRKYSGETVVISLPDEQTIYDYDFFGVWCKQFGVNFGQTAIPQWARVPPSPKMLGIKPENKLNCEILYDDLGFEIRWVLDGDDIVMQLVGKIEPNEYMAFGLGKDDSKSNMDAADAIVAWVERQSGQVHAHDYYLASKGQCKSPDGGKSWTGSCPDLKLQGGSDSLTLLHGAIVNGYSMVTFKRPQLGVDEQYDQHVYSDGQQSIIWAIGSLNAQQEVGYHRLRTKASMFIDFARNPQWNCPIPDLNASMQATGSSQLPAVPAASASQLDQTVVSAATTTTETPEAAPEVSSSNSWFIPQIVCPSDRTFYAQIGPTAGRKGYVGVTGRTNWSNAWPASVWYINGLMMPELVVERGQAYRFVVEGGNDKLIASKRHPLYLTDSQEGGFNYKTDDERQRERIFGGVAVRTTDGQLVPTAEGRLCEWKTTNQTLANPDDYATFAAYQRSLKLDCLPGQASLLKFVPDSQTPDQIYYQCYTDRLMGWRIRVVNSCSAYLASAQLRNNTRPTSRATGSAAHVSNNFKREITTTGRPQLLIGLPNRKDELNRRQSSSAADLIDALKAQQSEVHTSAMSFELPPASFINSLNNQNTGENNQMLISNPASADESMLEFGDELAASEELATGQLPSMTQQQQQFENNWSTGNSTQQLRNNATQLAATPLEQILAKSPGDFEFLDDQQLNLINALALATTSGSSPAFSFAAATGQQAPLPVQQASKNSTGSAPAKAGRFSVMVPKSLHAYARRLASLYYPMQQQIVSYLSSTSGSGSNSNTNTQQQQQQLTEQQLLANLHAQILAASTALPPALSQQQQQRPISSSNEPATSASAPSSSFSLASLVPKSKIDLKKSNLGKKFSKFRIKSGRKLEPIQTSASTNQVKQQRKPPTPDNEFNYDIFNNQLLQLEQQQKQLQSLENFAAAATAMVAAQTNAGGSGPNQQELNWALSPPTQQLSSFNSDNSMQMAQQQQDQESLLLAPTTNQLFNNNQQRPEVQQQFNRQQQQQAVFITKLPPQQMMNYKPNQRPQFPSATHNFRLQHTNQQQQAQQVTQQTRPTPSYLDSTDYSTGARPPTPPPPPSQLEQTTGSGSSSQLGEQLVQEASGSGAGSGNVAANANELIDLNADHMLAIERYSKQSSDRQPPSIVHPITGEQVNEDQRQAPEVRHPFRGERLQSHEFYEPAAQSKRFSSMLIDRHIVASSTTPPTPVTTSSLSAPSASIAGVEMLDTEQSAHDLKRLNTSAEPAHQVITYSANQRQFPVNSESAASRTATPTSMTSSSQLVDYGFTEQPVTTPTSQTSHAPATSSPSSSSTTPTSSSSGPLVPSFGPPTQSGNEVQEPLVLKSNLLEPIQSTLVTGSGQDPSGEHSARVEFRPHNFDSSPFTPLDYTSGSGFTPIIQQQVNSHQTRQALRPPPLIDAMLAQWASPFRPEPPVRVASYLSQQLQLPGASSGNLQTSQSSVTGSGRSASGGGGGPNLIILKPASLLNNNQLATGLKPEFLVGGAGGSGNQQVRFGVRASDEESGDSNEYLTNYVSDKRRLAGHQFDRLSSLSSPPSTSMVLASSDPMQVSNSMQFQFNALHESAPKVRANEMRATTTSSSTTTTSTTTTTTTSTTTTTRRPRVQFDNENSLALLARDNSTDNAILSHVMSLISANALPAPPAHLPLAGYSSAMADYFLPISGGVGAGANHQQLRSRSLRNRRRRRR